VAGRRWYRGELHLHSTHSDGDWTPAEIAALARPRGLDFMVLSDHNTTSSYEEFRALVDPRTLVIPGAELTTYNGHCLAIGVEDWMDWRTGLEGRSINDVAGAVRAAGGLFVVAHPDAMPDDVCTGCRWTHHDFDPALADAVEIWGGRWDGPEEENEGCVALWQRWLGLGHRLAATAATDAHRPRDWQGAVPLTYVLADELSRAAILDAIRAGRTYVSSGPELYLDAVDGGVRARCAGAPPGAEVRIITRAGRADSVRVAGGGELVAHASGWAYAELWNEGGDVLLAATSPLYL
jgi:predicted metal-dependent phosphoesterase TrpH